MPKKKNPGGRPTVFTREVLQKLDEAYLSDMTDVQAAFYAGIAHSTLAHKVCEDEEFRQRRDRLREDVKMKAKANIRKAVDDGDPTISKWLLEKRDPDYNNKVEIDHSGRVETVHEIALVGVAATDTDT